MTTRVRAHPVRGPGYKSEGYKSKASPNEEYNLKGGEYRPEGYSSEGPPHDVYEDEAHYSPRFMPRHAYEARRHHTDMPPLEHHNPERYRLADVYRVDPSRADRPNRHSY